MARLRRAVLVLGLVAAIAAGVVVVRLDARVRAYLAGPPLGGVRIYAAPSDVRVGEAVPGGSLVRKLGRLGYRAIDEPGARLAPGEYRTRKAVVEFSQRPSAAPVADRPRHVSVTLSAGRVASIDDLDTGAGLDRLALEPEMLAVVNDEGPALGADSDLVPPACRNALLAAEDRNFFVHPGVDPIAIVRALLADLRAGERRQGGSTLTQQLVKNAFLAPHRTLSRKMREALLAVLLELRTTKEDIFTRYLSSVYLGVDGGLPVHGFPQGAQVYFGKPVGELDPAECALLAGIIRSPNGLAPRRKPEEAVARRNQVLALMVERELLDPAAAAKATSAPLKLAQARVRPVAALYVAAEAAREVRRLLQPEVAEAPGLSVFTSVDADAQRDAERATRRGLAALERGRKRKEPLEAALVALDPHSGRVRALVGGRDYGSSPLDRAMRARRQPGSAFKPFVYLAALDPARHGDGPTRTVVSQVEDSPLSMRVGGKLWQPANYDDTYSGTIPLTEAIAESRNTPAVRLALDVGIDAVAQAATDLGISSPLPHVPSLALGVAETSLLELTAAYGVFASGGVRRPPVLVEAVVAADAELLYVAPAEEKQVLDPAVAYLVTHLLEGVVDAGTGRPARELGLTGPAAGKTGTTDDTRDAWFVGYTPKVVTGVWVGLDEARPTGLTGAQGALPIWTDFVRTTGTSDASGFVVPVGIVWRDVDPASGGLAGATCPATRSEPFLAGTEPTTPCELHRPVWTALGDGVEKAVREGGKKIGDGGRRVRGWFGWLFR